jgi:hypothetical protein
MRARGAPPAEESGDPGETKEELGEGMEGRVVDEEATCAVKSWRSPSTFHVGRLVRDCTVTTLRSSSSSAFLFEPLKGFFKRPPMSVMN